MIKISNFKKERKGFTLIELLVVISVIGLLASLLISRLSFLEVTSRDARRKSDINQYRTSLEHYTIKQNGVYPFSSSLIADFAVNSTCTTTLVTGGYLSACPNDPRYGTTGYTYRYQTNDVNGAATLYILWANLENGGYWYVCSSGKSGESVAAPTTASCW